MGSVRPSQGKWKSVLDMGALLDFLHEFPKTEAANSLKKTKKESQGGSYGGGNTSPAYNKSASLCTGFCRMAILYGYGEFTWEQAMGWKTTKDVYNAVSKIGWCSLGINGGLGGVGFTAKGVSDYGGATGAIEACKSGKLPPGTPVHTYNHGHIWGGDYFISDFWEMNKPVRADKTDYVYFPDSGVNVINAPAGSVSYSPDGAATSTGVTDSNISTPTYVSAGYASSPAPYQEVTWQPPVQGGSIAMSESISKMGKIGMVLGVHMNQKNLYGKKTAKKIVEDEVKDKEETPDSK